MAFNGNIKSLGIQQAFNGNPNFLGCVTPDFSPPPPPFLICATASAQFDACSLTYDFGEGPSTNSSFFKIQGDGLLPASGTITVTPSTNIEFTNDGGITWYSTPQNFPYSGGALSTAINYAVRLKSGLTINTYNETLTVSGQVGINVSDFVIAVTGIITSVNSFIISVKTDNAGTSAADQFTLPLNTSYTYNAWIDWGDGTQTHQTTNVSPTHTYSVAGTYTISIAGTFPSIYFNYGGDKLKLLNILQWGLIQWQTMNSAFMGCTNMVGGFTDIPDLSSVTTLEGMFYVCSSFNTSIDNWDVSTITNMTNMLRQCTVFNQDLNSWDVSNVTVFSLMFAISPAFNGNITSWDTSSATTLSDMFNGCSVFNQPIGNWNISNVTDLIDTFFNCYAFNQPLNNWDTSKVTQMPNLFINCLSFNQPLNNWDTSKVVNMGQMFYTCISFNQPLNNWDVSLVNNFYQMFYHATAFDQNIGNWNVINANNLQNFMGTKTPATFSTTNLDAIYNGWSALTFTYSSLSISFGTAKYTSLGAAGRITLTNAPNNWTITDGGVLASSTFNISVKTDNAGTSTNVQFTLPLLAGQAYKCYIDWGDATVTTQTTSVSPTHTYAGTGTYTVKVYGNFPAIYFNNGGDCLKLLDVTQWGTIIWKSFTNTFYGCSNLTGTFTDVPTIHSTVTQLYFTFANCTNFNGAINGWDVSNITTFDTTFFGCTIFNKPLNSWNTGSLTTCFTTFTGCLTFNQSLSNWNVSNVTTFANMFSGCASFNQNLSAWNVSSGITFTAMFFNCNSFNSSVNWTNTSSMVNISAMFKYCYVYNQSLSNWNVNNVTSMANLFDNCYDFNQNIGTWNMTNVTDISVMLNYCTSFNQDISSWNIISVTNAVDFMANKTFANYDASKLDAIYNTWSLLTLHANLNINFGTIKYTAAGIAGKAVLTGAPNNWTITDGGI